MENEKKVTSGKLAGAIAVVVVLAAALAALVLTGMVTEAPETAATQEAEVVYTIPADGNPDDETAKGSYTADDQAVMAVNDTVIARVGDFTLTNGQLQVYYWMEFQNFMNSYGSYAPYFGLDYTKPLDKQVCGFSETGCTWQQFFLAGALNTWKNHQVLTAEAQTVGYTMPEGAQAELDTLEEAMAQSALMYGMESAQELLAASVGGGATMDDYAHYMNLYYTGMLYFDDLCVQNMPTAEEVEAYFTEHEATFEEAGLTREDKYVSVRHLLIMPEGADSSNIRTETFDDSAWASSNASAEALLAEFEAGDRSEDSFAALAMEHSQDGSAANGGLYEDVAKGQMVENFENWCFDEARQTGDYGMVETEFGYHLMYFVSSRPVYVEQVENEMITNISTDLMNDLLAKYEMEAEFDKVLLGYLDFGGNAEEPVTEEPASRTPIWIIAGVSLAALAAAAYVFQKKEEEI